MVPCCIVFQGPISANKNCYSCSFYGIFRNPLPQIHERNKPFSCHAKFAKFHRYEGLQSSWPGIEEVINNDAECSYKAKVLDNKDVFPHVQTLRRFPVEELSSKAILVRFDSSILFQQEMDRLTPVTTKTLFTIKYIHNAGGRIILTSGWDEKHDSNILSVEDVAELLSSILQLKVVACKSISELQQLKMAQLVKGDVILLENMSNYKQERANNSEFSSRLASGVDIFVNDSFSSAHKILASTVGVTQFCYTSLAGFYFEECLYNLKKITECKKSTYVAVFGHEWYILV